MSKKNNTDFVEAMWNLLAQLRNIPYSWEEVEERLSKETISERPVPVIPYDVAHFIEVKKKGGRTLIEIFELISHKKRLKSASPVKDWIVSNSNLFATAWITDQYKVEPQPAFYWKKKEEHIASFDKNIYLGQYPYSESLQLTESKSFHCTKKEARQLLGKDFHMFEPVPVEENLLGPVQEFPHAF